MEKFVPQLVFMFGIVMTFNDILGWGCFHSMNICLYDHCLDKEDFQMNVD